MITAQELSEFVYLKLGSAPTVCDSVYSVPSREWVEQNFAKSLDANLIAAQVANYQTNSWDCDKFAFYAFALARLSHARTMRGTGLTFGVCMYHSTDAGPHCINFFVTRKDKGSPLELSFWEPQTQSTVTLTANEIASVWFALI